jgi:glucan phosphoethanolaminetransferase (alkaline phosphatase superfamily)
MIQRVQSVYLLLITVLMSFLLITTYADLKLDDGSELIFKSYSITKVSPDQDISLYKSTVPVVFLVLIIGLLSFVTIFIYNRRIVQIRLSMVNIFLILVLIISMLIYYLTTKSAFPDGKFNFRMPMIYPVLSLIFCFMAIKGIRHDELLVNSYKRIR